MISSIRGQAAETPTARAFDLSGLILESRRTTRILQVTFSGAAATGGGGLAYVIASALTNGPSTRGALVFTLAVSGLVTLFFVASILALIGAGPGAKSCVLDGDGLRLRYQSGRERVLSWRDPRIRLRLTAVNTSTSVSYDLTVGFPMLNPIYRLPMLNPISFELYSSVLNEAQARGLAVRSDTTAAGGVSVTTHQIRAKSVLPA